MWECVRRESCSPSWRSPKAIAGVGCNNSEITLSYSEEGCEECIGIHSAQPHPSNLAALIKTWVFCTPSQWDGRDYMITLRGKHFLIYKHNSCHK